MLISDNDLRQHAEQQRNFEELLLEISALFINLPAKSVDSVIEDTQRRICNCLNLDLSSLWQWSDKDARLMGITHLYSPPDGPELPPDGIDAKKKFPWIYKRLLAGDTLAFSNRDLPEEAGHDKESRRHFGIESSVDIPLMAGGESILGILTFDVLGREHTWSQKEVRRLKLVAEIFANALLRKCTEQQLLESEAKLSLAAESADAGLWELDCRSGVFWTTEKARKIFGFSDDDVVSMASFEKLVHPDDLSPVREAIAKAFRHRESLMVEYRILNHGKSPAWICSRGRPYFHLDGSPAHMFGISMDITERIRLETELKQQLAEIEHLKQRLETENFYLREDLRTEKGFEDIIGQSKELKAVLAAVNQVAATPATVLIQGETGTGKGLIAHAIHQMSPRKSRSFVTVNCAALPYNLIESELFGREKGAFTGAHARQAGRFEVADRGTIFLDEIGELPLELQAKLLRVLQEGEFERLGSVKTVKVDVRIITATARDLGEEVRKGRFRQDLFYRLNVFPVNLPPLRQRKDDIPLLAQYFIEKYARKMGKQIDYVPKKTLARMRKYHWPGNIREFEHLIERSVITSPGPSLVIADRLGFSNEVVADGHAGKDLASLERTHILQVLDTTAWKIEGSGGAAQILGLHPSTLRFRMKKLGIQRPGRE